MITRGIQWVRSAAFAIGLGLAGAAAAEDPVVVELYTSQGCSSCPPADAFLSKLAPRNDVIALALHVDYWDYIGWKDVFADPAYTRRQKAYARHAGRRSVYTPQMVIQGQEDVVGTHPMDVTDLIVKHRGTPRDVALDISRSGDEVVIRAEAGEGAGGPLHVQLVRYTPSAKVDVRRGENSGRTLVYSNIVNEWRHLGEWDTRRPLSLKATAPGDDPVVVLIQEPGPGAIEAAARLR